VKIAKKVAKAVVREMPALGPIMNGAVKEVGGDTREVELVLEEVEEIVRSAVKAAVKGIVMDAVETAAEKVAGRAG
jgi:hypothetical protein